MRERIRIPKVQPNVVDRVVGYFDPVRGADRLRARMVMALAGGGGGYLGGRRDRRATSEWRPSGGSADADLLPDLPTLRDRSRDLSRNAPLATGAINTVVTNVVGTGLDPQSAIDRGFLGLDDVTADEWQRMAEREWWLWAASQECDVTRTQDFCGLQDLIFRSALESGDVFVLKRFVERPGSPYGLKLQVLEADRVSNPNFSPDQTKLKNGRMVSGGVELDANGAPVAYYVLRSHPGDRMAVVREWDRLATFGTESGERMVLHLFRRMRPGQTRGVPYLASVIEPLKQLDRYSEAEIMAAVIASMFTVFVKSEGGESLSPATPTAEVGGSATDEDYKLGSGAILDLLPGESIETANPMRPNAGFDPFVQAILRQVGVALELPFEMLIKHFTASYSAARAAMLEAWKFFRARREWLAWNFCQPVYEAVITEAVARGRLDAPGFLEDPMIRMAYCNANWTGPPAGQIDPQAEIDAAKTRVDLGVSTLAEVTAEMTGGDWETKHAQRVKEQRMRVAGGLVGETVGERSITEPERAMPGEGPEPPPEPGPPARENGNGAYR